MIGSRVERGHTHQATHGHTAVGQFSAVEFRRVVWTKFMMEHQPATSMTEERTIARAGFRLLHALSGKFGYLLIALVALLLSAPLIVEGWTWNLGLGLFASAVLVAGLYAARPRRRTLAIGLILASADLTIGRLVFIEGGRWLVAVQAGLWLSTLIFVMLTILDAVFDSVSVDLETFQAALCVYLLIGLIWVYLYVLIELAAPGSFQLQGGHSMSWSDDQSRRSEFMRLFIFSFATLTSSRSGDLTPATGFAGICACLEVLGGHVYLAVVIARLVAMHVRQTSTELTTQSGNGIGVRQR